MLCFLAQVLGPDRSCRKAVSRAIAALSAHPGPLPSNNTSAYCQARARLPRRFVEALLDGSARQLEERVPPKDLWLDRHRVHVVDGASCQVPDTLANRQAFGLPPNVKVGCGFPVILFVGVFSLATGALSAVALGSQGRTKCHERRLFRSLWNHFLSGDIVLADAGLNAYSDFAGLLARGVHSVMRRFQRPPDFRRGERLGKHDHLVEWTKPSRRPKGLTQRAFDALPARLRLREVRIVVSRPGFRSTIVDLVTTLLDAAVYSKEALGELYRRRWNAELNFRHVKTTLGMESLSTKTPALVRKELLTFLLAYNLIRALMWEAGTRYAVDPLRISFKGSVQHWTSFAPLLAACCENQQRFLYDQLLRLLSRELVPDRPNRVEPRVVKRRPKPFPRMKQPRSVLKAQLMRA